MPIKDKEKRKKYQKLWMQKRRETFLSDKSCFVCGSNNLLTVASNGNKKISFSNTPSKVEEQLKSCIIFCDYHGMEYLSELKSKSNTKHGESKNRSPTYISWRSMIERCTLESKDNYKYYGGRGITICDRWMKYEYFKEDMGERPDNMTLDRIDPYGNYEPSNCRWADRVTQGQNKRKNTNVTS